MNKYEKKVTILYVEDEEDVREGYARALQRHSNELFLAKDGVEGLELYKEKLPDIVISDIRMPNMSGLEMVKEIKTINPHASVIFTTAHSESAYLLEGIELQVDGYLLKPVQKNSLVELIKKLAKNIVLEREFKEQQNILQHVIDDTKHMLIVTTSKEISFANKPFLNFFNISSIAEFNKQYQSFFELLLNYNQFISQENITSDQALYDFILGLDETKRIITLKNQYNEEKSFYFDIIKITDTQCLINFTDITSIESDRIKITKQAYTDPLTGIPNRAKFNEILEAELSRCKRYELPLSVAIFDIDYFKKVNDTYGHLTGDEILISLVNNIKPHLRKSDTFARWGGEEFVILFTNTELENALATAENFRNSLEHLIHPCIGGNITASFGLSEYKYDDTIKSIFNRADKALYEAKSHGRNRVEYA